MQWAMHFFSHQKNREDQKTTSKSIVKLTERFESRSKKDANQKLTF